MESYIMELFKGGELHDNMMLGVGNPLLDISVSVDNDFLKKYDLNPNDAVMAEKKHWPLYKELVEKFTPTYIAGGSVQNSVRVAQWILKRPKVCTYFGCVGDDEYAQILRSKAEEDGVNVMYQVTDKKPTGTCAVLLTDQGNHRSLCANLAAAQEFTPDHVQKPETMAVIEQAKLIYVSGFFLAVSPETVMILAKKAHEDGKVFAFNISAPFVLEFYKKPLEDILPYVDILFGNDVEMEGFTKFFGMATGKVELALELAALNKLNPSRGRVVVMTRGPNNVILARDGTTEEVPVTPLAQSQIVDTNGAGDAFTGGFLSQVVRGKSFKDCVNCGIYAAGYIIQQSGCSFQGPSGYCDC
ncbi:adenosine kinase-like [Helicoverpa zea]|uniref:adenosine kinase-like n=1 Tax=Helicoverpa zea TaxID=7113 RepID=UPI001F5A04EA|nr:adenosine kinase-like [Helicoverpa zea]